MKKQKRGLKYTLSGLALITSLVLTPSTTRYLSRLELKTLSPRNYNSSLIDFSLNKNSISLQSNLFGYSTSFDISRSLKKSTLPTNKTQKFSLFEEDFPQIETQDASEYFTPR